MPKPKIDIFTGLLLEKQDVKVDNSSIINNNGTITANKATGNYSTTFVGNPATTTSALNIGANSIAHGWYATAIGCDAVIGDKTNDVRVAGAIQLGRGNNQEAGTFKVGLSTNGKTWNNYKLIDATGKVPATMLGLNQIAGYDATKTQVLKNINGTFTWVNET